MIRTVLGVVLLLLLGGVHATESGAPASAGPAVLVHDFFPGESEGFHPPPQLTRLGQALFFIGDDRDSGPSLWRSDGTPGGSFQIPIAGYPGVLDDPQIVGVVGNRVVWSTILESDPPRRLLLAADEQGRATPLGTYGPTQHPYTEWLAIVGTRYFFQDCIETECRISSTDGTTAGTGPVAALASRFTETDQNILGAFADRWLVFSVGQAVYSYDVADGQVRNLLPETTFPIVAYAVGASLYLRDQNRLWVSRLDAPQPSLLFKGSHVFVAGWRGDILYFVPDGGTLWSTDGRSVHTYKGDRLENFSVLAEQLGAVHSRTFFALPGYYTGGLYAADETTREVREIHHVCSGKYGCGTGSLSGVTVVGDQGFLTIYQRLWRSDGTISGTKPHPVLGTADAGSFRVLDDRLVLGATSKTGDSQLWATDGGVGGTEALSDGTAERPFHVQSAPERLGDSLYVWGSQKPVGQQLWRVEGGHATAATAQQHQKSGITPYQAFRAGHAWLIQGAAAPGWIGLSAAGKQESLPLSPAVCTGEISPCPTGGLEVGDRYLFSGATTGELAATDGTAAGTRTLPLEDADGVFSVVSSLGPFRNRALVLGDAGGLWTSDGTPEGTRFVTQLPIAPAPFPLGRAVGAPVAVGSLSFLFRRVPIPDDSSRSALELWRTDGTAAGTLRLASIPFDKRASPYPSPTPLAGRLFFRAFGILWVSDGSVAGTRPLPHQLPGGTFALSAGTTTLYAGAGYLVPKTPQTLWAIDPSTLRVTPLGAFSSLYPGYPGAPLGPLVGDTLFFFTEDSTRSTWWRTEGTHGSTVPLPEPLASQPVPDFVSFGDRRYFPACDVDHGCELWSTDRLGEDTRLVQDLWAGPRGSYPYLLGSDDQSLWFAATEPSVGDELWRFELSAAAGASPAAGVRPTSRLTSRLSAREREAQAKRALEPRWRRMLR